MHDSCICDGRVVKSRPENFLPSYMEYPRIRPTLHFADIYIGDRHYFINFIEPPHILYGHVPGRHTPKEAQMCIEDDEFYLAGPFEMYDVWRFHHHHANATSPASYPPTDHIYVAVPEGRDRVYSAPLRRQSFTMKDERKDHRLSDLKPGTSQVQHRLA